MLLLWKQEYNREWLRIKVKSLMKSEIKVPAPWSLSGNGLVLLYHFPKEFCFKYGFLEKFQQEGFLGWIGAVMLVNYHTSDVGPYSELIFMPGLMRSAGRLGFSISKIYVSTAASRDNGYNNWGIPKELADFTTIEKQPGQINTKVAWAGRVFFEAEVKLFGPKIPISTKVMPLTRIIQQRQKDFLLTPIRVSGKVQPATLSKISAHPEFFPPVNQLACLTALSVQRFQMVFPVPEKIG